MTSKPALASTSIVVVDASIFAAPSYVRFGPRPWWLRIWPLSLIPGFVLWRLGIGNVHRVVSVRGKTVTLG